MFTLPPAVVALLPYVLIATLALGLIALITILAISPPPPGTSRPPAEAARPMPAPSKANAEAEIVSFLATLQAKGRLVDFLMDDINAVNDAQIGAAARVVHAGCKSVLQEHFRIRPIREEGERSNNRGPRQLCNGRIPSDRQNQWPATLLGRAGASRLEDRLRQAAHHPARLRRPSSGHSARRGRTEIDGSETLPETRPPPDAPNQDPDP